MQEIAAQLSKKAVYGNQNCTIAGAGNDAGAVLQLNKDLVGFGCGNRAVKAKPEYAGQILAIGRVNSVINKDGGIHSAKIGFQFFGGKTDSIVGSDSCNSQIHQSFLFSFT